MDTMFDFEQPLADMKEQLEKLEQIQEKRKVDVSASIQEMKFKIVKMQNEIYENLSGWQKVQISRHAERPYTLDYIEHICDDFIELHGDRTIGDDHAIVGGLGSIDGQTVMIIGHQKGKNTKERQFRNFGMANPEGYRKALRLMKMAEKFDIPVVTLIDTPGAFPGLEAEERGQAEAIARNLFEMAKLKTPILCFIVGEGASGGALGIGIGDRVYMLQYSWYSVISPENCSTILWRSWDHKEEAAEILKLTAEDMLKNKLIDGIISEPEGGAHNNYEAISKSVKKQILDDIKMLGKKKVDKLVQERIEKFCSMGVVNEGEPVQSAKAKS